MDTIREYLNNLFLRLPETPEVIRAKEVLLEMMEDKYDELIADGKSEKEAVGIVVSEFGSLEEVAEELGIKEYISEEPKDINMEETASRDNEPKKNKKTNRARRSFRLGFEEARQYVSYAWKHGYYIAVGVLLCILAPFGASLFDGAADQRYMMPGLADGLSGICFFGMVAAAVIFFCSASGLRKPFGNLSLYNVCLDAKASDFLQQKQSHDEKKRLQMRMIGVVLCIISVVPSSINHFQNHFWSEFMDSSVLLIAGVGVFLLVLSCSVGNRYEELERGIQRVADQPMGEEEFVSANWNHVKKREMSSGTIVSIVILGIVIVGGCSAINFTNMMRGILKTPDEKVTEGQQVQKENRIAAEAIKGIKIDYSFGNVYVKSSDSNATDIVMKCEGGEGVPEYVMEDGILKIESEDSGNWFSFGIHNGKSGSLTLEVPQSFQECSYEIDVDAGNVELCGKPGSNVLANHIKIDVDAGNVLLENVMAMNGGKVDVDVDAGNLDLNQIQGNIKGTVDAGNVQWKLTEQSLERYNMNVGVDLGEITINGAKHGTSYQKNATVSEGLDVQFDVDMGNIEIDAPMLETKENKEGI